MLEQRKGDCALTAMTLCNPAEMTSNSSRMNDLSTNQHESLPKLTDVFIVGIKQRTLAEIRNNTIPDTPR
jgi:hypothetical protein